MGKTWGGGLPGAVAAVVWTYANIQVLGYLALRRTTDHWPTLAAPAGFFGLVFVPLTYYLMAKILATSLAQRYFHVHFALRLIKTD